MAGCRCGRVQCRGDELVRGSEQVHVLINRKQVSSRSSAPVCFHIRSYFCVGFCFASSLEEIIEANIEQTQVWLFCAVGFTSDWMKSHWSLTLLLCTERSSWPMTCCSTNKAALFFFCLCFSSLFLIQLYEASCDGGGPLHQHKHFTTSEMHSGHARCLLYIRNIKIFGFFSIDNIYKISIMR